MSDYVLSCCSTADVTRELLESRDIKYLYFNYFLNGEACKDDFGATNPPAQLYAKMLAGADAKTSQVSAGDYAEHFEKFLSAGKDVLHVTLSSGISSTYNSACVARDQLAERYPDRKVIVVDSLAASAGYGLLMDKLADLRDEGMGLEELGAWAEEHKHEVQHWFFSSDLTFFVRGGRISKAAGLVGGILKLKPIISCNEDGVYYPVGILKNKKRGVAKLIECAARFADGNPCELALMNGDAEAEAAAVAHPLLEAIAQGTIKVRGQIAASLAVHTGPGLIGILVFRTDI